MARLALIAFVLGGCVSVNPAPQITEHIDAACVPDRYERIDVRIDWEDARSFEPLIVDTGVRLMRPQEDASDPDAPTQAPTVSYPAPVWP